jgi:hypothetical protein
MTDKRLTGKGIGRKRLSPDALSRHLPKWAEQTQEKPQDRRYSGWDSNRTPHECKHRTLPTHKPARRNIRMSLRLRTTPWRHAWTSALAGSEQSDSRSGRFSPKERIPGTHWIRCWMGLEPICWMSMKKIPTPLWYVTPVIQPVAFSVTD